MILTKTRLFGILLAASLGMGTAMPAAAITEREFCTTVADDSAYIMGVRQRGEPMTGVLDAINWMKYRELDSDLHLELAVLAWNEPIGRSEQQRQAAVRRFAQNGYSMCRAAVNG